MPDSYYHDFETNPAAGVEPIVHGSNGTRPVPPELLGRKANATLLMLARNSDVDGAVRSVREMEDRFNRKYAYPWVFLNEEPFSDEFKRCVMRQF